MKRAFSFFLSLSFLFSHVLSAVPANKPATPPAAPSRESNSERKVEEKFNIMFRDENSDTDALAIPFDDSEVEDEEELDYALGKDVFDLPQPTK